MSSSRAHARLESAAGHGSVSAGRGLISEDCRDQNRALHGERAGYGSSSGKWVPTIAHLITSLALRSVLDYGCGKGLLKSGLATVFAESGGTSLVRECDPAVPGKDAPPEPAELVVCTDALEHVEPAFLDAVLDDLRRLPLRAAFLNVATRPAEKTLPDGRNTHLIVEPCAWWLPKLRSRWTIMSLQDLGGHFVAVGTTGG